MAMKDEYDALIENKTWDLVPRPSNANVIQSLWIFRHKKKSDGSFERYKARLVGNGANQQTGVDCGDTFSPVVKPATIRTVLSVALSKSCLHQLDVKNAFLHGNLAETVYMHQPPGFRNPQFPDHVCLLKKSLYGLKQAPRAWYQRFTDYVATMGFSHSVSDHSLFIYHHGNDIAYILLYVDDIILTASSDILRSSIMAQLSFEFAMKDLGPLSYFLGVSVTRHSEGLFLSQKTYAEEIIERAGMSSCKPSSTPVDTKAKLSSSSDFGLHLYPSSVDKLISYKDADWAGCPDTRRSTSGYCVYLGDNFISWSAKRQHTLSRSSAKAEYRGVINVVSESCWLRNLLLELCCPVPKATLVYCENTRLVYLSDNPVQHQRTKHIEMDIHFVREKVARGQVRVLHIPSRFQIADIFTKGLPLQLFDDFRDSLNIRSPPVSTSIGDLKSPGIDGCGAYFLKKAWRIVKTDILRAVHDFFDNGRLYKAANFTLVTLIPKHKEVKRIKEYRPISCYSTIYKIISKVLTKRMGEVMTSIVGQNQVAFVPVATSVSYRFNINGNYATTMEATCGLRQGDLISPLLFVIMMEYLNRCFQRMQKNHNFDFHTKCEKIGLTNLCFADDLLLFARGDEGSVTIMMEAFDKFSKSTGLKVNPSKCCIFFGGVDHSIKDNIKQITHFKEGKLPFRYLGIPMTSKKLAIHNYMGLIDKITFFWTGSIEKSCKAPVAWKSVCQPKRNGGLNLIDLEIMEAHVPDNASWIIKVIMQHRDDIHQNQASVRTLFYDNVARPRALMNIWLACHESETKGIWRKILEWIQIDHNHLGRCQEVEWIIQQSKDKGGRAKILKLAFTESVYEI
ncbi:hypothetical protein TSUD_334350 [Trifolium subterraneum]|uniref:Reverse transcriptase domain-containing protein n=1 Tax=Trifolium subterraneum TaxID=3900 RepID=A0A2Z6N2R9_TRISU|nr:hypothetical protein TSUD_334350 [Trifolium subterraneum]